MKDMELNFLDMAAKNPVVSQNEIDRRCEQLKSKGWTDNNTYKDVCSGTMMNQVRPIDHMPYPSRCAGQ